MATRIIKTQVTGTSTQKCTFSAWVKKASNTTGNDQVIYDSYADGNNRMTLYFVSSSKLALYGAISGSTILHFETTRLFRDLNAWYHIAFQLDTTQATDTDRFKLYVNGERIMYTTGFSTETYPSPNVNLPMGTSSYQHAFGFYSGGGSSVFQGSMSHLHFTDGYAYASSSFGSTDSTTGEWKINTSPSVTYGNNGFFILKDGNSLTDQSPNTNNFTVNTGTLTKTEDCPSNVFCTLNPLDNAEAKTFNLSNGNLTMGNASGTNDYGLRGTLGVTAGKYYWEVKSVNGGDVIAMAESDKRLTINNMDGSPDAGFWGWQSNGTGASVNTYNNGTFSNSNTLQGWANNSIIGVALDMDNGKVYMSIDGVWKGADNNTSDPANQTNPMYTTIPTDGTLILPYTEHRSSGDPATHWNFGNGYFGSTQISSAGTNASNIGIFEYDVPTGFTALSTKGLNE
jgi:hypothetical protein